MRRRRSGSMGALGSHVVTSAPAPVKVWFQRMMLVVGSMRTSQMGRRFTGAEKPQLVNVASKLNCALSLAPVSIVVGKLACEKVERRGVQSQLWPDNS